MTVAAAARALGTTPQTVRRLLRDGALAGRKEPWGERFVWVPSRQGVEDFLARHGRLEGRRRDRAATAASHETPPGAAPERAAPSPSRAPAQRRPLLLRVRYRAAAVVLLLGVPLLIAYATALILPDALWFHELGQLNSFEHVAAAHVQLWVLAAAVAGAVTAVNLLVAASIAGVRRTAPVVLAIVSASILAATVFAPLATQHWQLFLLWDHQQAFGIRDPLFGKDVGFFVFALPAETLVANLLLGLLASTAVAVAVVFRVNGALTLRPLRAAPAAQAHLAALAAAVLVVVAWRLHLVRYALVLQQPSLRRAQTFAGAGYVDVHVRSPGLTALSVLVLVLAAGIVAAPIVRRRGSRRAARWLVVAPSAALALTAISLLSWLPAIVQRFAVNPSPLLSEQPYVASAIAATRHGLDLDSIEPHPYAVAGPITAADVARAQKRFGRVVVWDRNVIRSRMRDLVSTTPYFRPQDPTLQVTRVGGAKRVTVAGVQEIDLRRTGAGRSWASDRLVYTHGLGLPRFSAVDVEANGQPRLLEAGLGLRQPRIYFGDLPASSPSWVLTDTRRAEADVPGSSAYHYDGSGGIRLAGPLQRAAFALRLGSKDLLISHDLTPRSRILLHRDVRERLAALAPFVRWDSHPVPQETDGRIVWIVDGCTTSTAYPYAQRFSLGEGSPVAYARASVRATVDAFTGRVAMYVSDDHDPVVRAWAQALPRLLRPGREMPSWLRRASRYPTDLFATQAAAFRRFHTTRPDVFASRSDEWATPTSLSGSLETVGRIQFDESDEDSLRHTVKPEYKYAPPPGRSRPELVLSTVFSPRRGQNLVATLDGWTDARGRPRLAMRLLPRDPGTLGPAQVSRQVFASPRVSSLLGVTNLELADLNRSSLDAVSLGKPHFVFLPSGRIQTQSIYKGASGPGVSRIIGVTAFVNGRAGLGRDVSAAVRQALNQPPAVAIVPPRREARVDRPVTLGLRVRNAKRERVTVTSRAGRQRFVRSVRDGPATVVWTPRAAGKAQVDIEVEGLDGSTTRQSTTLTVLRRAPTIRFVGPPASAMQGRTLTLTFRAQRSTSQVVEIATREGTFTRRYALHDGAGVVRWTPNVAGQATVKATARGPDGQTTTTTASITVRRRRRAPAPSIALVQLPSAAAAGSATPIAFAVRGAREVTARITDDRGTGREWRFARPSGRVSFRWTPPRPGTYRLELRGQGPGGVTTHVETRLTAISRP